MYFNPSAFKGRTTWIFDVDYTLYGPEAALFEQVVPRITAFVAKNLGLDSARARAVQREYYLKYGSTLRGLHIHHGVEPKEYSAYVHDIDYTVLKPAPSMREKIAALPGRKLLFTNATMGHARDVLANLGMSEDDFDGAFDVEMAGWKPKPDPTPYEWLRQAFDFNHASAVFFEDTPKNLLTARDLGWGTAWISAASDLRQQGQVFEADARGPTLESILDQILKVV